MFTQEQTMLLDRLIKSDFVGARSFALNVKRQGFMSDKQYTAMVNMNNSIRPWSSKSRSAKTNGLWDHDDLAEGWDGI